MMWTTKLTKQEKNEVLNLAIKSAIKAISQLMEDGILEVYANKFILTEYGESLVAMKEEYKAAFRTVTSK